MNHSTYSFADVVFVMSHPAVGTVTITGEGVGSITVSRSTDVTQHDLAADGSVMVSKILASNGTIALSVQQTSSAMKWLKKWHDYIQVAPTEEWAKASAILKNPALGETVSITGISPQKHADAAYLAAGQQVTWNLMAVEIAG